MKSEKLRTDELHEVAHSATHHLSLVSCRSHSGQVALYLIAVLVAICILTMMNVGIYLSVSAKNKAMNAGDAAALAVANYQGELLNRIGQMNIDHLKAALDNDEDECEQIVTNQLRACFLGPISGRDGGNLDLPYGGISAGNKAAKENGVEIENGMDSLLKDHARDIRLYYTSNPDLYPEPWDGAWGEYATALEIAANAGVLAGPDNVNFIDAAGGHTLLDRQFYNAIAGRNWCWFKFNAPGLLNSFNNFNSWGPLPSADADTRWRRRVNSEVYSLNLRLRIGSAVDLLGTNLICRLLDVTEAEIAKSYMITNQTQAWMFYDDDVWRNWWEIDPYGTWQFPVVGQVRQEYNVRGCAAACRVYVGCDDMIGEGDTGRFAWVAAAKPFGTVVNDEGEPDVVTADKNFVTPAFERSCLVPIDSVGGKDLSTSDPEWMAFVRNVLPKYLQDGPTAIATTGNGFAQLLVIWERPSFRRVGSRWLKYNSGNCMRPLPGSGSTGGTPHGH